MFAVPLTPALAQAVWATLLVGQFNNYDYITYIISQNCFIVGGTTKQEAP
jgi:hypothetical protein